MVADSFLFILEEIESRGWKKMDVTLCEKFEEDRISCDLNCTGIINIKRSGMKLRKTKYT